MTTTSLADRAPDRTTPNQRTPNQTTPHRTCLTDQPEGTMPVDRAGAEALGGQVMAAAADVARHQAALLRLVGEFDACDAVRWWHDLTSVAHWLSWACSLAPGTAREHVRVARALRRMPQTVAEFEAGTLSYSKVRSLTRLVDDHDEEALLELARHATASQLDRTVAAYRAHPGVHADREPRTRVSWTNRDDGCVQLSAVLSPEQGAAVIAALEAAAEANSVPEPAVGDVVPPADQQESHADRRRRAKIDGLVEIANHYLNNSPDQFSGEDRTMVVVDVNAAQLVPDTPAGTSPDAGTTGGPDDDGPLSHGTCRVRGHGNVEGATARRLACSGVALGVIRAPDGEPLSLGRTKRLGTRAQRRALMVRDQHCQFPGCRRTRNLKVHHIVHWLDGGRTDLDNLMLLCQHHHTAVHEGGLTITRRRDVDPHTTGALGAARWRFSRPDGSAVLPTIHADDVRLVLPPLWDLEGNPLTGEERQRAEAQREELITEHERRRTHHADRERDLRARYGHVDGTSHTEARALMPIGGGAGFSLHNCVEVLFSAQRRAAA
ncbi:DUF222 domain-containing protein [Propionibacteriaceae bacterium Y2011]